VQERYTAKTVRRDLEIARTRWIAAAINDGERKARESSDFLVYRTKAGYADFHSLRHGYITRLFGSNVKPLLAQKLARHADLSTTMRYAHAEEEEVAVAQEQVRPLPKLVMTSGNVATGDKSAAVG
jgi:integrase